MTTYYKAVRYDYGSFYDPEFKYGPTGTVVRHPAPEFLSSDPSDYISVSTVPANCIGFRYKVDGEPSRLLVVEPIGDVWSPNVYAMPSKRAVGALMVIGELPISEAFGPNGKQVVEYLDSLPSLSAAAWDAARDAARSAARHASGAAVLAAKRAAVSFDAARDAAWAAARSAALSAALSAARSAAFDAARDAALALVVRDLITAEQFETFVAPMRAAGLTFEEGH